MLKEYFVNSHLPHHPQIFAGIKCALRHFLQAKNKHLTPPIFGGMALSWRATREANGQFQKHAKIHYTAENRLATFLQNDSLSWLTIWKANKERTYSPPRRQSATRYNTLDFASKAMRVRQVPHSGTEQGNPTPLARYRNAAQIDHNMQYLKFTCVCCYNRL